MVAGPTPTNHPRVPADLSQLWLVPGRGVAPRPGAFPEFEEAVKLEVKEDFARALPILSKPALQQGVLGPYVLYYKGLAELRLGRAAQARDTFQSLADRSPVGYLTEAAALRQAESSEVLGDQAGALAVYEKLSKTPTTSPDDVLMRMGRAAKSVGDSEKAAMAFSRVYFEFPFGDLADQAGAELAQLPNVYPTLSAGTNRYKLELGRAERLFGGKRYAQARSAFEEIRRVAPGDDRELVTLRVAECDYFLKRPRNTRDGVRPYLEKASRQGEALFFHALAARDLGDEAEYLRTIRRVVSEFPDQSWAEEALNNLATRYIVTDEDDKADETLREMYERFPAGRYAEKASWKIGWTAYKSARYADTARVFERAAVDFPRSDYRPAWLYWSGRAHDALNDRSLANARYGLAVTDYQNSYYGRLAMKHLDGRPPERRLVVKLIASVDGEGPTTATNEPPPVVVLPPNQEVIRALLSIGLFDQAIDELRYAQRAWSDSSAIQATLAWTYRQQGVSEKGSRQFGLYRGAINVMKRAYPQYLAAGGEDLPRDVLSVIFPVAYWDLIRQYSDERGLDPYFVAALVAQESTFVADIQSPAKAWGLMQLMPSTARQYAKRLGLPYSAKLLTNPEANIRIGTAYLADKIRQFGDLHLVLASYNAGEGSVRRWVSERSGFDRDAFIDDIPYPETQGYVKKILGTAEDYRRLYGPAGASSPAMDASVSEPVQAAPGATLKTVKKTPKKNPKKTPHVQAHRIKKSHAVH